LLHRFGLSVAPRFRWECLTIRTVSWFPAPATSHVASGFPALRAPAHFTSRLMRPIRLERLPRSTVDTIRGTPRRVPACRTAIPCSTASSRSLDAGTPWPDGVESSFLPSLGCRRNTRSSDLWQSISPNHHMAEFSLLAPGPSHAQLGTQQQPKIRLYMSQRAAILSAIASRAAGEISIGPGEVRSGDQAAVRGTVNQVLRARDLWSHLEPREQKLLSAATGSWSSSEKNRFPEWCEQLRLLRWTLGIDAELTPLAHDPGPDSGLAAGLLESEPPVFRRQNTVEIWSCAANSISRLITW
jgi:hypothetical protein